MAIDTEERTPVKNKSTNGASQPGASKSNKKLVIIILSVVGGLIVLSIVGTIVSGMLAKKAFESGISAVTGGRVQVDANKDGGEVTIKGDDGDKVDFKTSKELPDDLPPETPLYPGAKLQQSSVTTVGDGASFMLGFHTSGSHDDIFEFYKKSFSENGWKINATQQNDSYNMIHATNESAGLNASFSEMLDEAEERKSVTFRVTVNTNAES